jgi:hypothetical protein
MTERKYQKWTQKTDLSPVRRFRFTENEWKVILEAVGFYADHLAQVEYPKVKELHDFLIQTNMAYHHGLHENWLGFQPGDPNYDAYQKADAEYEGIKKKVNTLNAVERQLMLAFGMVSADIPKWALTTKRMMR